FRLSAVDNYAAPTGIKFQYRISTAFNAPETGWLTLNDNTKIFTYNAEQHHNYFEVRVEARDGSGSSPMAAQVFRADLRDPVIDLEAFYTNPDEPEESVRS